jgi:hypothetical protein
MEGTAGVAENNLNSPADQPRLESERPAVGADLIIPGLAVAFTTYYLIGTASLTWEAKANGVVVGLLLYALVAVQLVRIGLRIARRETTLGFGGLFEMTSPQKQRIALVVITALFIVTLSWVGVAIGLFAAMFASMWALGERDWRSLIGVSLGTTATVYLLFIVFLQLRLPRGPVEHVIAWLTGAGA